MSQKYGHGTNKSVDAINIHIVYSMSTLLTSPFDDIDLRILLEDPPPGLCYFPNRAISGAVIVVISSSCHSVKINSICVTFRGDAEVSCKEPTSMTGWHSHGDCRENYFKDKIFLLGNELGKDKVVLEPGTMSYPFTYTLPNALPASFRSVHGTIHYEMEARVKCAQFVSEMVHSLPFMITGILDLNAPPYLPLRNPTNLLRRKKGFFLCCRSGHMLMDITIPKRAFVPCEFVVFSGKFTNNSRKVARVQAILIQLVTYCTDDDMTFASKVLSTANSPPIEKGKAESWSGEVVVPLSTPPSGFGGGCELMEIEYFLQFEMKVEGKCGAKLRDETPIIIGTIPFKDLP